MDLSNHIKRQCLIGWLKRMESGAEDEQPLIPSLRPVMQQRMAEKCQRLRDQIEGMSR